MNTIEQWSQKSPRLFNTQKSSIIGVLIMIILQSGCATQSTHELSGHETAYQAAHEFRGRGSATMIKCPTGFIPICEVVGGDRFNKLYGKCVCGTT